VNNNRHEGFATSFLLLAVALLAVGVVFYYNSGHIANSLPSQIDGKVEDISGGLKEYTNNTYQFKVTFPKTAYVRLRLVVSSFAASSGF